MQFDDDEGDFWHDEPTQRLRRIDDHAPVRGSRAHTGAVPIVQVEARPAPRRVPPLRRADGRLHPRWAQLALVAVVLSLLVGAALVVRGGSETPATEPASAAGSGSGSVSIEASSTTPSTPLPAVTTPEATVTTATAPAAAPALAPEPTAAPAVAPVAVAAVEAGGAGDGAAGGPATIPTRVSCSNTYKVAAGDYWLGIAQKTGSTLKALLAANGATAQTVLYPGRPVCLPAGAAAPAAATTTDRPATTATAATSAAPATAAPATAPPATVAPTIPAAIPAPATTARPSTTSTPANTAPPASYTRAQVEQIIRDVFPDDQEDRAIAIAIRESNLRPTVRNYCCFGLFQVYYNVHRSWLAAMGITSAEMLYDPVLNARAAYALYQRSGGWGPWGG